MCGSTNARRKRRSPNRSIASFSSWAAGRGALVGAREECGVARLQGILNLEDAPLHLPNIWRFCEGGEYLIMPKVRDAAKVGPNPGYKNPQMANHRYEDEEIDGGSCAGGLDSRQTVQGESLPNQLALRRRPPSGQRIRRRSPKPCIRARGRLSGAVHEQDLVHEFVATG